MEENIEYNASIDASMENRNKTEQLRESSNYIKVNNQDIPQITGYRFKILVQDKPTLEGILSREDMELIHRSYSSEGSNLSQRSVARYFPTYTFQEFKKILRAFNITKASSSLAPHIIEESSIDKLVQLTIQQKENSYLKKLEQDKNNLVESKYKDLVKEHYNLKNKFSDLKEFFGDLNYDPKSFTDYKFINTKGKKTLILNLADMHIGAKVSDKSIYNNEYNETEVLRRLKKILDKVNSLKDQIDDIFVFNLGDSLDGYNGETTRGGHKLPQNMDNKEQVKTFINCMLFFFKNLKEINPNISYICVGESNHDGDFGWLANHKLITILDYQLEIQTYISDYYIDSIKVDDTTFILCHGKDNTDMFKNLPLYIDPNTENKLNEYLDYHGISGNIVFVKGDLHQSAISYAKKFTYWSVGSLFGSSSWIHKNFGNTKACCDYGILSDNTLLTGRIILN